MLEKGAVFIGRSLGCWLLQSAVSSAEGVWAEELSHDQFVEPKQLHHPHQV